MLWRLFAGLVSRPDRILYSHNTLQVVTASTHDNDIEQYTTQYSTRLLIARILAVIRNDPCGFDCGPRGRCECGVCVLSEEEDCVAPCSTCARTANKIAIFATCIVLIVMLTSARIRMASRCVSACVHKAALYLFFFRTHLIGRVG